MNDAFSSEERALSCSHPVDDSLSSRTTGSACVRIHVQRFLNEKIRQALDKAVTHRHASKGGKKRSRGTPVTVVESMASVGASEEERIHGVIRPSLLNTLVHDEDLAQLGDAFVNFTFSLALSIVTQRCMGFKISDRVLAEALKLSRWGRDKILILKGKKGVMGNYAEALMLIAWAEGWMTIDEFVGCFLTHPPSPEKLTYHRTRKEALIPSVTRILDELHHRYVSQLRKKRLVEGDVHE